MIEEPTAHRPSSDARRRNEPRFTPGTMLGERYRIVALLGSGGMGEVYRAEDTKLGQQVALKFLPHHVGSDPARLERLYSEVRLGRQVSHPNVCRLYDIGEWEGNHFLAMEYVDGEDLASLLRRIGKLPAQKAFDIARDVCAGLAAAHGLGIIHRDLKPANIMIDGRGQARITDFGLAVVAEDLEGRSEIAGTPAYMAPEQLAGGLVSHKTDLYALGLIFYEVFTGKRLFEGGDSTSRRTTAKSLSGSTSSELDPVIQRVIARCVQENPDARPSSIHAVIASLPGGDPLQAAIDAGETPSPQMVAAAGEVGDLKAPAAWTLLFLALIGLGVMASMFGRTVLFRLVPMPKPPEALADRAKTILESAGYNAESRDSAYFFDNDEDFFRYMVENRTRDLWQSMPVMRPGPLLFSYRQSPRSMAADNEEGRVTAVDPPLNLPGMTLVTVDTSGRLVAFIAVPPRHTDTEARPAVDWSRFFEFAGGDFENLRQVPPNWLAPVDNDRKVAWEATFRGDLKTPIRIEAASYAGKPVWFRVIGPWVSPTTAAGEPTAWMIATRSFFALLFPGLLIVALVLARRNLLRGRGDRRTAMRLGLAVLVIGIVGYLFRLDHVSNPSDEQVLIDRGIAWALYSAAQAWLLYIALEPYVRRKWPHTLISWTRLFAGRFRDPMIGRDLLVAMVAGPALLTIKFAVIHAPAWFGQAKLPPISSWVTPLVATRNLIYAACARSVSSIFIALIVLFMLFVAYVIFRRKWAAIAVLIAVATFGTIGPAYGPAYELAGGFITAIIITIVLLRCGLLAFALTTFLQQLLEATPLTLDPDAWYFGRSLAVLLILLATAIYGFWSSLGEKPALGMALPEEA